MAFNGLLMALGKAWEGVGKVWEGLGASSKELLNRGQGAPLRGAWWKVLDGAIQLVETAWLLKLS